MNSLDSSADIVFPGFGNGCNELLLVGFEHPVGLIEQVESHLHDCFNFVWMNGEIEIHWDLWESILEQGKSIECKHRDDIIMVWVIVGNHVLFKLRNNVSEPNAVDIHVHGNV